MSAGLSPFGALTPAEIARLMQQAQPMAPQTDEVPDAVPPGFSGFIPPSAPTMQPQAAPAARATVPAEAPAVHASAPLAPSPASLPSLVGQSAPAMPQVSASTPPPAPRAAIAVPSSDEADKPAPNAVPAQARAPLSLAPPTAPAASPAPAASAEPSFGDRFTSGLKQNGDLLIGLGTGLMSTPGWGRGVAAGLQYAQKSEKDRVATDLARAELGLKQQKATQEQRALTGNAQYVASKIPGITADQAMTLGSNSTFMNELFKGVLPPTELFRQYTDDKGNIWSQNARTGQATVALKAEDDKTVAPVSEEERARLGLPAGSYQKDANGKISSINPTGTTINMGAEKAQDATVGKAYGDLQVDLSTKGRNAASTLNTLSLMEQAMKTPGFYSGAGGEGVKRANQVLAALGVKDAKAASAAEVFDALSNKVVLDGLGGSLGPGISNTDRDYIARTAPTLAQSEAGNRDLIGVARALAQRQQAVSKLAREYAVSHGGRLDSGFDQQLEDFAAQNPLFPQAQASSTASAPQEPPQGAPAGTRMAPDGRFYAPDPARPGKFLMVR